MDKSNLDRLIQEAASQQEQDLRWVGNLYRQRLKALQEVNDQYQRWIDETQSAG